MILFRIEKTTKVLINTKKRWNTRFAKQVIDCSCGHFLRCAVLSELVHIKTNGNEKKSIVFDLFMQISFIFSNRAMLWQSKFYKTFLSISVVSARGLNSRAHAHTLHTMQFMLIITNNNDSYPFVEQILIVKQKRIGS